MPLSLEGWSLEGGSLAGTASSADGGHRRGGRCDRGALLSERIMEATWPPEMALMPLSLSTEHAALLSPLPSPP